MQIDKEALHDAVERAAEQLPEGWQIDIQIELDGASVYLFDEYGDSHDYPVGDGHLAGEVLDALEYALETVELTSDE